MPPEENIKERADVNNPRINRWSTHHNLYNRVLGNHQNTPLPRHILSPDLSLTEHLWNYLGQRHSSHPQINNLGEMETSFAVRVECKGSGNHLFGEEIPSVLFFFPQTLIYITCVKSTSTVFFLALGNLHIYGWCIFKWS